MLRRLGLAIAALVAVGATSASAQVPIPFARQANTEAGRAVYEPGPTEMTVHDAADKWVDVGRDILPFDYEQGVTFTGDGLVFSSRGALYRTTLGCPAPSDAAVPCYDVATTDFGIAADEVAAGYNHVGAISAGLTGPAAGYVFAPLEKSASSTGKRYTAYDVATLQRVGTLEEDQPFVHHSWLAVAPSGEFLIDADESLARFHVYSITEVGTAPADAQIQIARRADLDVTLTGGIDPAISPTGCAFVSERRAYCADWVKDDAKIDIRTDMYRLDFSAPVGTPGARVTATKAFTYRLTHLLPIAAPYAMEGEGLTAYARRPGGPIELHMLVRGETETSMTYIHFAPASPPAPASASVGQVAPRALTGPELPATGAEAAMPMPIAVIALAGSLFLRRLSRAEPQPLVATHWKRTASAS